MGRQRELVHELGDVRPDQAGAEHEAAAGLADDAHEAVGSPSHTAFELPLKRTCATSCSMPSIFAMSSVIPQLATSGELNMQLGMIVRSQCRLEPVTAFSAAMAPW